MKPERFEEIFEETIGKCRAVLLSKNVEYSRNGDRLHNFKAAAAKRGTTPEDALRGMAVKHTTSIDDMVADLKEGIVHPLEKWDEKLIDDINYLILLRGLIAERWEQPQPMPATNPMEILRRDYPNLFHPGKVDIVTGIYGVSPDDEVPTPSAGPCTLGQGSSQQLPPWRTAWVERSPRSTTSAPNIHGTVSAFDPADNSGELLP